MYSFYFCILFYIGIYKRNIQNIEIWNNIYILLFTAVTTVTSASKAPLKNVSVLGLGGGAGGGQVIVKVSVCCGRVWRRREMSNQRSAAAAVPRCATAASARPRAHISSSHFITWSAWLPWQKASVSCEDIDWLENAPPHRKRPVPLWQPTTYCKG